VTPDSRFGIDRLPVGERNAIMAMLRDYEHIADFQEAAGRLYQNILEPLWEEHQGRLKQEFKKVKALKNTFCRIFDGNQDKCNEEVYCVFNKRTRKCDPKVLGVHEALPTFAEASEKAKKAAPPQQFNVLQQQNRPPQFNVLQPQNRPQQFRLQPQPFPRIRQGFKQFPNIPSIPRIQINAQRQGGFHGISTAGIQKLPSIPRIQINLNAQRQGGSQLRSPSIPRIPIHAQNRPQQQRISPPNQESPEFTESDDGEEEKKE
jgi:hypothetical protein